MAVTVTMLQTRRGEDGNLWASGGSYSASDAFAQFLITHNLATGAMPQPAPSALSAAEVAAVRGLVAADTVTAPATNLAAAVGAAGSLTGTYYYTQTFVTANGETAPWPGTASAVTPSSQRVELTAIPLGPSGTTARRIYRTTASPTDPKDYRFLAEIADNTTTTYSDNTADGSLGAAADWSADNAGTMRDASGARFAEFSDQSTAFGKGTFETNTGYASTAVGYQALKANTTGRRNTAMGVYALTNVTSGYQNTALGVHAGQNLTVGFSNTLIGYGAGFYAGVGAGAAQYNTAVGDYALGGQAGVGIGSYNVAVGYRALYGINTADNCIGIGSYAGQFANASRQLFLDPSASLRANLAAAQDSGLIYGKSESTAQTQVLHLNAAVRVGWGSATVSQLPAASAALRGFRAYVTDASVAYTSANVGSTVAGGGSNTVPVFCNGTNWVIG